MLNSVFEYRQQHPDNTIIIEILQLGSCGISIKRLKSLIDEDQHLVLDCYEMLDFIKLRQADVSRVMYHYPVATYNDLYQLMFYKPYAISVREPLTFDLPQVREVLDQDQERYIKIRVVPHIGRPADWADLREKDNGIRHFWIAPQMAYVYEPYVDVLDLYDADSGREQALVDVYSKNDYMFGLNSLLKHCESSLLCGLVDEEFTKRRLNCKQRCFRMSNDCHYCERFEAMTKITQPSHSEE